MVKFSREALDPFLTPGVNELEVTGSLITGEEFKGSDRVRVIDPPGVKLTATVVPAVMCGGDVSSFGTMTFCT